MRLDGVGDAAVCTPLVAGLLAAGHTVGAALTTRNAALFAARAVAPVHVLERIPWPRHGSTPETAARARAEIAAARYDVALVASEEPEAYALAAGIPVRAGFTTAWAKPFKALWTRRRLTRAVRRGASIGDERAHEVEILYRLGAGYTAAPAPARDVDTLRRVLLDDPQAPARERVVLQLGPKWRAIGVPERTVRALVQRLVAQGARVVAAAGERAAAAALAGGAAVEVPAGLAAWKHVLDGARAVVTVDSGAAHVAGMLGVPVVDIFPDAHFEAQRARWRPWAAPAVTLRAGVLGDDGVAVDEALREH